MNTNNIMSVTSTIGSLAVKSGLNIVPVVHSQLLPHSQSRLHSAFFGANSMTFNGGSAFTVQPEHTKNVVTGTMTFTIRGWTNASYRC